MMDMENKEELVIDIFRHIKRYQPNIDDEQDYLMYFADVTMFICVNLLGNLILEFFKPNCRNAILETLLIDLEKNITNLFNNTDCLYCKKININSH